MKTLHPAQKHAGQPPAPTCDNCVHTFKHNGSEDLVVCVPHLRTMPANHSLVCDLYSYSAKSPRT